MASNFHETFNVKRVFILVLVFFVYAANATHLYAIDSNTVKEVAESYLPSLKGVKWGMVDVSSIVDFGDKKVFVDPNNPNIVYISMAISVNYKALEKIVTSIPFRISAYTPTNSRCSESLFVRFDVGTSDFILNSFSGVSIENCPNWSCRPIESEISRRTLTPSIFGSVIKQSLEKQCALIHEAYLKSKNKFSPPSQAEPVQPTTGAAIPD